MRVIGIDFESYYDQDFSLSKMTTESYIRDPRFELIGVSVKCGYKKPAVWFTGTHEAITAFLDKHINWEQDAILCHNTAFDGAILSWILNRSPKLWLDTLSMARPLHLKTIGVSLAALAAHYKLGTKGNALVMSKGKRRKDFTAQEMREFGQYACTDIDLTFGLFKQLKHTMSALEMQCIDYTLRMFIEPKFILNPKVLQEYLADVIAEKDRLIAAANEMNRDKFMGSEGFAELLKAEGVDPPTKWSEKQKKTVYAFAKTDKGMKDLLSHDNPRVQALAACRLGVKTTIEETRAARFIEIAKRGKLPIMLNYWGAGTGRFSGGDKINPQNLKRGGKLRQAMEAPVGFTVIASDLSQIEARILALVAGQVDLVELFATKGDPYCVMASDVYGRPITKADIAERFLGKTCILGLGYYTGAAKLRETLRIGNGGVPVIITLEEAERIVKLYRKKNNKIAQFWRTCGNALDHMVIGGSGYISQEFNIRYEGEKVILPNGAELHYPELQSYRNESGETQMRYLHRGKWTKIYSGLLCENIIQALARGVIVEYLVTIGAVYGVVHQCHDEIISIVPTSVVPVAKTFIETTMSTPVTWLPGLPVACEVKHGPNYGAAK